MGSVWVAEHRSLNTRVAVKFVSAELVKAEPTVVERFTREAALAAQIKSPHVVQTLDHGVMNDGRPYIVMELLEGESLQQRLERVGPLGFDELRAVVTQTCKALGKAHRLGIVHRDIKPDNLFLTPDEDEPFLLKVLDFGIAKQTGLPQVSKMTSTGSMIGTPQYMSPEQVLSGNTVDFRTDLWAVAVVAYHCLTGDIPFDGETLGSLCVAIANGRFPPPSTRRPGLSSEVDRWFSRALAVDREKRFGSAKELAQSFALALNPQATIADFTTDEVGLGATIADPRASSPMLQAPGSAVGPMSPLQSAAPASFVAARTPAPATFSPSRDVGASSPARTLGMIAVGGAALLGGLAYFFLAAPRATEAPSTAPSSSAALEDTPAPSESAERAAASSAAASPLPAEPSPSAASSGSPPAQPTAAPASTPAATVPRGPSGAAAPAMGSDRLPAASPLPKDRGF